MMSESEAAKQTTAENSPASPVPLAGADGPLLPQRSMDVIKLTALFLIIASALWFLLTELANLFKPLLIAIFLCYLILPVHLWLVKRKVHPWLSGFLIVLALMVIIYWLGVLFYNNAIEFNKKLPEYAERGNEILDDVFLLLQHYFPELNRDDLFGEHAPETSPTEQIRYIIGWVAGTFFDYLATAAVVGFYLIFLLIEFSTLSQRLNKAFKPERAAEITSLVNSINQAIVQYVTVKVYASCLARIIHKVANK